MKGLKIKLKKPLKILGLHQRKVKKINVTFKSKMKYLENFKPNFPNIFFIDHPKDIFNNVELDLKKRILELLNVITKNNQSYMLELLAKGQEIYNMILEEYLLKLSNDSYWKLSNINPNDISDLLIKFKTAVNEVEKSKIFNKIISNNDEIYNIIIKFSANYIIYKSDIKNNTYLYVYFSKKGLQYIDTTIFATMIKFSQDFKQISYDTQIFSEVCQKILKSFSEYKENSKVTNRQSVFKNVIGIVSDILTEKTIPQTIKIILTEIIDLNENKNLKSKNPNENINNIDNIIENSKISWMRLNITFVTLCTSIGKRFIQIIYSMKKASIKKNIYKEILEKSLYNIYEDLFTTIKKNSPENSELILENQQNYVVNILKTLCNITIEKNTDLDFIDSLIKNYLHPIKSKKNARNTMIYKIQKQKIIDLNKIVEIQTIYYEIFNTKKSLDNPILNNLKDYLSPINAQYEFEIGKILFNLLEDIIFYKHKKENIYINEEFYYSTIQPEIFPSFGPNKIDMAILTKLLGTKKNHNKLILESYTTKEQLPIRYSPKFKVSSVKDSFIEDQIKHGETDFCKLNLIGFYSFINNLQELITLSDEEFKLKCENNWPFFKFFLPKETNLDFIKTQYNSKDFITIMRYITNCKTKEDFNQIKLYDKPHINTYQLHKLLQAVATIKFELRRFLITSFFLVCVYGWYPKLWMDARGRQYPNESVLNNTKSPKFRSMFYYVNSHYTTLPFIPSIENDVLILRNMNKELNKSLSSIETKSNKDSVNNVLLNKKSEKRKNRRYNKKNKKI